MGRAGSISILQTLSLEIAIFQYYNRDQIQKSVLYWSNFRIIENPVSKIFSLLAKLHMMISTKTAPKPHIKTLISKIPAR